MQEYGSTTDTVELFKRKPRKVLSHVAPVVLRNRVGATAQPKGLNRKRATKEDTWLQSRLLERKTSQSQVDDTVTSGSPTECPRPHPLPGSQSRAAPHTSTSSVEPGRRQHPELDSRCRIPQQRMQGARGFCTLSKS